MIKGQIKNTLSKTDEKGNTIIDKAGVEEILRYVDELLRYQEICRIDELEKICKFPNQSQIVLQRENIRVIFYKQNDDYVRITTMECLGAGCTEHSRTVRIANAGFELISYKAKGYAQFRNASEVSWYATMYNNTPYDEVWDIKDGMFIPTRSYSVNTD